MVCAVKIVVVVVPDSLLDVCWVPTGFQVYSLQHPTDVDGCPHGCVQPVSCSAAVLRRSVVDDVTAGGRRQLAAEMVGKQGRGDRDHDERVANVS